MDYVWTIYIRDIFIILAAAALIIACGYVGVVAWQVYRMAESLSVELEPILASARNSASTVESTTGFIANRFSTPVSTTTNTALGLWGLVQLARQARQSEAATRVPPPPGPAIASEKP